MCSMLLGQTASEAHGLWISGYVYWGGGLYNTGRIHSTMDSGVSHDQSSQQNDNIFGF